MKKTAIATIAAFALGAGAVMAEEWPDLPVGIKNGVAVRMGDRLIVGLGSAEKQLFALDLKDRAAGWQKLPDFTGPAPSQPAAATAGDTLYVFGGSGKQTAEAASPIVFDTGWKLDSSGWQQLASTTPAGLLGASALGLPDGRIAVVGGYNKAQFDAYLAEVGSIDKDKDPKAWGRVVNAYMGKTPEQYQWNDLVLVYDPAKDSWSDLGQDPELPNTGSAVVETAPGSFAIINGEVKPGLRSAGVKSLTIADGKAEWGALPPVPPAEGEKVQEGLAGAFAGLSGDAVLVAGGANFPGARANADARKWYAHDGLTKTWNDDVFALRNGKWSQVGKLDQGLAYGGSFSVDGGVLIVGGEDADGKPRSEVYLLSLDGDTLRRTD